MSWIIGIAFVAVVGYLVLSRKKPEVVQEIVEEVKAVEKKPKEEMLRLKKKLRLK